VTSGHSSSVSESREWEQGRSSGHVFKRSYACVDADEPEMLDDLDGDP